jgi:hypothetical protein
MGHTSATAKGVFIPPSYLLHKMSILRRTFCFSLVAALLLVTAHRLPAPIQEVPESPTPTPTPALQLQSNPPSSATQERADPARFAGTWAGRIKVGKNGDFHVTLAVNSDATSLTQDSKRLGELTHPTAVNGRTLSWRGGKFNNVAWTLTPNSDGQTALAATKIGGVENTAIFKRVRSAPQPSPTPSRK